MLLTYFAGNHQIKTTIKVCHSLGISVPQLENVILNYIVSEVQYFRIQKLKCSQKYILILIRDLEHTHMHTLCNGRHIFKKQRLITFLTLLANPKSLFLPLDTLSSTHICNLCFQISNKILSETLKKNPNNVFKLFT